MVSMARPLLADPHFVLKASQGQADRINTCIACNQACLDHVFSGQAASCLVNPFAGREHRPEWQIGAATQIKRLAVVGAGPAGMACACMAAQRGHHVTLFESNHEIGGQFNLAKQIPGKQEFSETLRYFGQELHSQGVRLSLGYTTTVEDLLSFDEIILATGVVPRAIKMEGIDHPKVLSYLEVLRDHKPVGQSVAIIGAGGIGFDVATYLSYDTDSSSYIPGIFLEHWGIDQSGQARGGLCPDGGSIQPSHRQIYLLQRRNSRPGKDLGKTTGWIHRLALHRKKVEMLHDVQYRKIDQEGLHISVADSLRVLPVDHVVVCAGQESEFGLEAPLLAANKVVHRIGGAQLATELDAKRAIEEGTALALGL